MDPVSEEDIRREAEFIAMIQEGIADADAGRFHPHEKVMAEIDAIIKGGREEAARSRRAFLIVTSR